MPERVAIAGISSISCFGVGHQALIEAVAASRSGIEPIASFDTSECHSHSAATIQGFDPAAFIPPLKLRRIDAVGRLALASTRLLFDHAGCPPGPAGRDDVGIALGTCTAGLDSLVEYLGSLTDQGPIGVPAILFSNTVSNAPASLCAIEFGLRGPNVTFNQREASSMAALAFAVSAIRERRTVAMVTGGAESIEQMFFRVHDRFRALSPVRGAGGREAARPFDRHRNGPILGEGCFLLLIESVSSVTARGARSYGEIVGIGAAASESELNGWPADRSGLVRAMRLALVDANVRPEDVACIIATANGSPHLDRLEAHAIADVFGPRSLPVASLKGAIGESGASAAAGLIAGLLSVTAGEVIPTVGLSEQDPALPVRVSGVSQPARGSVFLVNSVASGGAAYSVAVRTTPQ